MFLQVLVIIYNNLDRVRDARVAALFLLKDETRSLVFSLLGGLKNRGPTGNLKKPAPLNATAAQATCFAAAHVFVRSAGMLEFSLCSCRGARCSHAMSRISAKKFSFFCNP